MNVIVGKRASRQDKVGNPWNSEKQFGQGTDKPSSQAILKSQTSIHSNKMKKSSKPLMMLQYIDQDPSSFYNTNIQTADPAT